MSRIGKQPITVPKGVDVKIDGQVIEVSGPKGDLSRTVNDLVSINIADGEITVDRPNDSRQARAMHGLTRSLLAGMVEGVTDGFSRKLLIEGIGYRSEQRGDRFLLLTLGYSHPFLYELPDGVDAAVDPKENSIVISGADKQLVGAVAAELRSLRPPEPYKGKGIRYADERIRRKEGKAGGK